MERSEVGRLVREWDLPSIRWTPFGHGLLSQAFGRIGGETHFMAIRTGRSILTNAPGDPHFYNLYRKRVAVQGDAEKGGQAWYLVDILTSHARHWGRAVEDCVIDPLFWVRDRRPDVDIWHLRHVDGWRNMALVADARCESASYYWHPANRDMEYIPDQGVRCRHWGKPCGTLPDALKVVEQAAAAL